MKKWASKILLIMTGIVGGGTCDTLILLLVLNSSIICMDKNLPCSAEGKATRIKKIDR